jgi:hypothetical protein
LGPLDFSISLFKTSISMRHYCSLKLVTIYIKKLLYPRIFLFGIMESFFSLLVKTIDEKLSCELQIGCRSKARAGIPKQILGIV